MEKLIILQGHRAVVTGASSGIGKEFSHQLAAMGCDLVIVARRLDRLNDIANELISKYQINVECVQADLTSTGVAQVIFERATEKSKIVTMLINNAGLGKYGLFTDFPYSDHHAILQVNAVVPTEITYLFVKHMLSHGKKSHIIQVSSIASFQPVAYFTVYSGTKGYMRYFSETLAFELRKTNINVMCLCPGGTYTEFFDYSGQKITSKGHKTMMSAAVVVQLALKSMLNGETTYIPGFLNKLACFFPRFLPNKLSLLLAFKTMNQAVKKSSIDSLSNNTSKNDFPVDTPK